jgi:hypothetical protein
MGKDFHVSVTSDFHVTVSNIPGDLGQLGEQPFRWKRLLALALVLTVAACSAGLLVADESLQKVIERAHKVTASGGKGIA